MEINRQHNLVLTNFVFFGVINLSDPLPAEKLNDIRFNWRFNVFEIYLLKPRSILQMIAYQFLLIFPTAFIKLSGSTDVN